MSKAPFTWHYYEQQFKMEFVGGPDGGYGQP